MLDKLPDLVIELILFEYLSYEDVFNLRLVCKKLNQFKKFSKLNLFVNNYPFNDYLFYTNKLINHANSLRIKSLETFKSVDFSTRFNKIQQLSICCSTNSYKLVLEDLNCLNRFQNLVHLQINSLRSIKGEIDLPNLRICSIHTLNDSVFKVNCPKLKALQLSEETKAELIDKSNRLDHLSIKWVNRRDEDYLIKLFSNLNSLSTLNLKSMGNLLLILDKLNKSELHLPILDNIQLENCWYLKDLNNLVSKLTILNQNSSTKHIKFAINNRIVKLNELNEVHNLLCKHNLNKDISKLTNDHLKILGENPSFDCFLSSITELELNEDCRLDKKLICKLKNINNLKIKTKDDKLVELMIKNWDQLTYLHLSTSNLKCEQLKLMSIYFLNLKYLTIENEFESNIGLDKLIRFKNLKEITVKFKIGKRTQLLLFNNCPSLEEISISTGNETKAITRIALNRQINNLLTVLAFFTVFLVCVSIVYFIKK